MEIRSIHVNEIEEAVRFISHCFEYPQQEYIDRDFPQLFAETNRPHLYIAKEQEILAHAGAWLTRLRVDSLPIAVGGIGAVCTAEPHRGRGLASMLLKKACDDLKERGALLAFLWSGDYAFYEKLGFHCVGKQWAISIPPTQDVKVVVSTDKTPEFFALSLELIQKWTLGVDRDLSLHTLLLSSPGCECYSVWDGPKLRAYAVVEKGKDLTDHIHEWAGEEQALDLLVHSIAKAKGKELKLLSPILTKKECPWIYSLAARNYPVFEGILGLIKILDSSALLTTLSPLLASSIQIQGSGDAYTCTVGGETHILSEKQLIGFLFNGGTYDPVSRLPLRLWWWGMESV